MKARAVQPRPDEDVSVQWQPVVLGKGRRFAAIPVPAVAGIAALALVALFATLLTLINRDGAVAAEELRAVSLGAPVIQIDRDPGAAYVAEIPQLDRIRAAFGDEIADGRISVDAKGDYIAIRVGDLQLFDTGSVEEAWLRRTGAPHRRGAERRGRPDPSRVIPTMCRCRAVAGSRTITSFQRRGPRRAGECWRRFLADPARITAEGRGEDDPVGDNATPTGAPPNRRVEIMLGARRHLPGPRSPSFRRSRSEFKLLHPHSALSRDRWWRWVVTLLGIGGLCAAVWLGGPMTAGAAGRRLLARGADR